MEEAWRTQKAWPATQASIQPLRSEVEWKHLIKAPCHACLPKLDWCADSEIQMWAALLLFPPKRGGVCAAWKWG